jgi:hypothetical protein
LIAHGDKEPDPQEDEDQAEGDYIPDREPKSKTD